MNILATWEVLHHFKDYIFAIIYKLLGTEHKDDALSQNEQPKLCRPNTLYHNSTFLC